MELLIKSLHDALVHSPSKPTYAIRIFSSHEFENTRLRASANYIAITEYVFDDVQPHCGSGILFTQDIAEKMLKEFGQVRASCEALLVHCNLGRNRGPAVGIALNEIFHLGHDPGRLKEEYPRASEYIYETLKAAAKNLKL